MPRGYRGIVVAVGLVSAAHHPDISAQAQKADPQERSARALEGIAPRYDEQTKRSESSPDARPCEPGDDQRDSDLCAQWKAADAAADAAWWAAWGTWISGISGLLVLGALFLAFQSNRIARDTAKRQLRAYVGIERVDAGVLSLGKTFEVKIKYGNQGQTPAISVAVVGFINAVDLPVDEASLDAIQAQDAEYLLPSNKIVGPGVKITKTITSEVEVCPYLVEQLETEASVLLCMGTISYEDVFGSRHSTNFRLKYGNDRVFHICARGSDAD